MEEVELGGMEDEENEIPVTGYGDDEYRLFDREEVRLVLWFNPCKQFIFEFMFALEMKLQLF